ncbi:unnamed protein product [Pylaiella littoralis]
MVDDAVVALSLEWLTMLVEESVLLLLVDRVFADFSDGRVVRDDGLVVHRAAKALCRGQETPSVIHDRLKGDGRETFLSRIVLCPRIRASRPLDVGDISRTDCSSKSQ